MMFMIRFFVIFAAIFPAALAFIPTGSPLQYITPPIIAEFMMQNAQQLLSNALLPSDAQDALAIFVAEGVAGALGGIAAKGVSFIDGNKNNRDSALINAGTAGAYFGVAGAVRSLAEIAGLSKIAVDLAALLFGISASEALKFRSRLIESEMTRVGDGPTMYELMRFKNPSMFDLMRFKRKGDVSSSPRMPMMGQMTRIELEADVVRWAFITLLLPRDVAIISLDYAAGLGAFSGLMSQLVRESKDKELDEINTRIKNAQRKRWDRSRKSRPDYAITRLARAGIEGAVQLLTYEASKDYVMAVDPYFKGMLTFDDPYVVASSFLSSPLFEVLGNLDDSAAVFSPLLS